jgi:hypothetical protein
MALTKLASRFIASALAAKHRRAASTHDRSAQRHMETAAYWGNHGVPERAVHEARNAMLLRQLARLERDRAQLEELTAERA